MAYYEGGKNKSKAVPAQVWTGPEGSRKVKLPDFKTVGTWRWQCCQPSAPAVSTPRKYSCTHFYQSLSWHQGHINVKGFLHNIKRIKQIQLEKTRKRVLPPYSMRVTDCFVRSGDQRVLVSNAVLFLSRTSDTYGRGLWLSVTEDPTVSAEGPVCCLLAEVRCYNMGQNRSHTWRIPHSKMWIVVFIFERRA